MGAACLAEQPAVAALESRRSRPADRKYGGVGPESGESLCRATSAVSDRQPALPETEEHVSRAAVRMKGPVVRRSLLGREAHRILRRNEGLLLVATALIDHGQQGGVLDLHLVG